MEHSLLSVRGVSAGYGKLQILTDISTEAAPGRITVVVGPNGSGKSTLLKTIAGLTSVYGGSILFHGQPIERAPPHEIARRGLAYLPQTESVFSKLTVKENITMAAYTISDAEARSRLEEAMGIFPQIKQYLGAKVQTLSGGERQMVAMIMALVRKPSLVMFDEPTANLSPKLASEVLGTIGVLSRERNLAVVLVEQNARKALELGDDAFLLVGGRVAFRGGAKELLAHKEFARMYLGLGPQGSAP